MLKVLKTDPSPSHTKEGAQTAAWYTIAKCSSPQTTFLQSVHLYGGSSRSTRLLPVPASSLVSCLSASHALLQALFSANIFALKFLLSQNEANCLFGEGLGLLPGHGRE